MFNRVEVFCSLKRLGGLLYIADQFKTTPFDLRLFYGKGITVAIIRRTIFIIIT